MPNASSTTEIKSDLPQLLSIREAAEILRVGHQVIRRAIARGQLPSIRAGRQHRIRRQDLSAYLRRESK